MPMLAGIQLPSMTNTGCIGSVLTGVEIVGGYKIEERWDHLGLCVDQGPQQPGFLMAHGREPVSFMTLAMVPAGPIKKYAI